MIVNNNLKNYNTPINKNIKSKSAELSDNFEIDNVKKKNGNILDKYKKHREAETEERSEPWWTEAADGFHLQGDVLDGLKATGSISMASAIGSGIGSIGLLATGAIDIKEGIKEKNNIKIIEGTSQCLAGAASGADFTIKTLEAHNILGEAGGNLIKIAEPMARGFGIVHGTIDIAIGTKDLIQGIKEKNKDAIVDGSLEIGIGSTMLLGAIGIGGPVTAAALATFFVAKIAYDHREGIEKIGKKIINKLTEKDSRGKEPLLQVQSNEVLTDNKFPEQLLL